MKETTLFPLPSAPPRISKKQSFAMRHGDFTSKLYSSFFSFSTDEMIETLTTASADELEKMGEKKALQIFHDAAERVPAYKDFLKKHKIKHEQIKDGKDFKNVPLLEKNNYLRKYSLKDISWDGELHNSHMISVSSGSTGKPFFWPRGLISELETTIIFETILKHFFHIHEKSTLFVNAFAMGMYVGGPITLNSVLRIAHKGYRITIVTPGYSLDDIHRVITELGYQHDQVVIASYPPFAKDIIDDGTTRGIKWKKMSVKFLLAGEGFSEGWRDYIANAVGADPVRDVINLYGTADAAILGHETIASNTLRRVFGRDQSACCSVFGDSRLPSVLQYHPSLRFFEVVENELILTASAGVPLVRYNIHDQGGIISYDDAMKQYKELTDDADFEKIQKHFWKLPFIYLLGRSDFTTVFYGANIYPENIHSALEIKDIHKFVTCKFTMFTDNDAKQNQRLIINVECRKNVKPSIRMRRNIENTILKKMLEVNSEYNVVYKSRGKRVRPKVYLFLRGDKKYFGNTGVKQKWAFKKNDN